MRDYEPYYTEDGSIGLYSYVDKDVYHSKYGALTEAWEKFVLPSNINNRLKTKSELYVLDICYGIGYNTKALMCSVINENNSKLKNISLFSKICYIVSICINNITKNKIKLLSSYIDKIHANNFQSTEAKINIDCLDINEHLVKISPFFKTIKTPEEIYVDIIPKFLNCFEFYYTFKKIFTSIASIFYPKNNNEINELLELKFKNMHIDTEYKMNGIVNYILLNSLYKYYGKIYPDSNTKKFLSKKKNKKYFYNSFIHYALFNQIFGYNLSNRRCLSTFLHNIYYSTISKRYSNVDFLRTEKLFDINFYVDDARKSIQKLSSIYDVIFLDAFTYTKAPQLWSVDFIKELYSKISDDGVLLTYSNSAQIRNTLLENGFYVGKIYNNKCDKFIGTIASKDKSKIEYPLNNYELGLCATKAGIPYRDPYLRYTAREILEQREYEFRHSNLMSSSKYIKIRTLRSNNNEV